MVEHKYVLKAFDMAMWLFEKGHDDSAVEVLMNLPKYARKLAERNIARIDYDYDYSSIYLVPGKINVSADVVGPAITPFALSKRLRRRIDVKINLNRGHMLYIAVAREFAYLPAFQYMYDDRLQMPKIWERAIVPSEMLEKNVSESIRGVSFRLNDVYEVSFYPVRVASKTLSDRSVSMPHLRSIYSYLQKISQSKLAIQMAQAFSTDISVDYVVNIVSDIPVRTDSSVSFWLTIPRRKNSLLIPAVNMLVSVRMLTDAKIFFVDRTVTTFPIMFLNAKKYLPDPPSDSVAISPTTMSILLSEFGREKNGKE